MPSNTWLLLLPHPQSQLTAGSAASSAVPSPIAGGGDSPFRAARPRARLQAMSGLTSAAATEGLSPSHLHDALLGIPAPSAPQLGPLAPSPATKVGRRMIYRNGKLLPVVSDSGPVPYPGGSTEKQSPQGDMGLFPAKLGAGFAPGAARYVMRAANLDASVHDFGASGW